jgi:putative ABC transport system permease protein
MTYLDRMVARDLLNSRGRTALLVLALAVAFLMPAGSQMAFRSLEATRDGFAERLTLADLEVRLLPEDLSNLPTWDIPGLSAVEHRLLMPGTIQRAGETVNALFVFLPDGSPAINRLERSAGRALKDGSHEEALLERSAVEHLGFKNGDAIAVQVGRETFKQTIVGVVRSPEFLIVAANPEYLLPEKGSLAVLYSRLARVRDELGFVMVNDLLFRFAPGADHEAVKRAVLDKLRGRKLERVIARAEHMSWKHITIDVDIYGLFRPAISLVLALLAAALVLVTFDGFVRRTRRELGTLKAMGCSGAAITRAYLLAGVLLALLGALLGTFGAIGFRHVFLKIYGEAHGLAYLEEHLYLDSLLSALLWILSIALASALLATKSARRASPIALLRPLMTHASADARGSQVLSRLPLALRLGVRNVLRSPRLTATSVLGVALTVSVGSAYLICLDSMKHTVNVSLGQQQWQRAVSFAYPVLDEDYLPLTRAFPGARLEPFVRTRGTLRTESDSQDVSLLGIQPLASLRGVQLKEGRLAQGPGEVVVGADLLKRLHTKLGAELLLSVRHEQVALRIVGVKSDVLLGEAVLPIAELQKLSELEDQASGVFVRLTDAEQLARFDQSLRGQELVAKVVHHDSLTSKFMLILTDIRKLVMLVAGIALLVGVLFISANLSMTMQDRATELSTLWALGADRKTALHMIVVEIGVQTLCALLVAAPLTWILATLINRLWSDAWFEQTTFVSASLVATIGSGVVALSLLSGVWLFSAYWRSGMLDNLRARGLH